VPIRTFPLTTCDRLSSLLFSGIDVENDVPDPSAMPDVYDSTDGTSTLQDILVNADDGNDTTGTPDLQSSSDGSADSFPTDSDGLGAEVADVANVGMAAGVLNKGRKILEESDDDNNPNNLMQQSTGVDRRVQLTRQLTDHSSRQLRNAGYV